MVVGSSLRWKPLRRFDATIGYIGRKDYLEDPFLRDGISEKTNTIDPLITAQTFYADGNWLFYPGDIELNGQIALGAADTSDVFAQRAIQQVFSEAGLSVSDFKLLRSLMRNPTLISSLDREELLAMQTPQGFLIESYLDALKNIDITKVTDDCAVLENAGISIYPIIDDKENIKITTKEDILLAEAILKERGEE